MSTFALERDPFGRLVLIAEGRRHVGVVPVRAFPVTAPEEGVALLDAEGHELVWLPRLSDLPREQAEIVREELASREFVPEIRRLLSVSTFATPSVWTVETDRGITRFTLKGEEDIRRLKANQLLISDSHGIQYLVPDLSRLDRASRRLLDRFL